jgi:lipopolysaccharide transport system permease protein
MTENDQLLFDAVNAARLWRVWTFLGIQDTKARFRRSFIGPLWILINLGLFVGGAGLVYSVILGQQLSEFLPFLVTGFVIWGFLLSTLTESGTAFVTAEGYIKQFPYPKQIYLLRALVNYDIILLIGFAAIILMQIIVKNFSLLGWLMAIPGLVILDLAALAHITVSAYLGTRFRDWPHALTGLLQVVFFVTPILFPAKILSERHLDFIYRCNPLYYLIEIVRHPIVSSELAPFDHYCIAGLYTVAAWAAAMTVARTLDRRLVFLL